MLDLINSFATGDAYMRQFFQCLQGYAGSERVNRNYNLKCNKHDMLAPQSSQKSKCRGKPWLSISTILLWHHSWNKQVVLHHDQYKISRMFVSHLLPYIFSRPLTPLTNISVSKFEAWNFYFLIELHNYFWQGFDFSLHHSLGMLSRCSPNLSNKHDISWNICKRLFLKFFTHIYTHIYTRLCI